MAEIFNKTGDGGATTYPTLILDNREALIYPLPFTNWSHIKFGMLFSFTDNDNPNADMTNFGTNTVSKDGFEDHFFFGLKNSADLKMPKEDSNEFLWGFHDDAGDNIQIDASFALFNDLRLGTFDNSLSVLYANGNWQFSNDDLHNDDTLFASFVGMELTLEPSASQNNLKIDYHGFSDANNRDISDPDIDRLLARLTSSFSTTVTNPVQPRDPPHFLFLNWPYYTFRIRVHAIGAIKIS